METECLQPLPEKFEKNLKIKDEKDGDSDNYDSDNSMMSEGEEPPDDYEAQRRRRREKSKQVVKDFLQQVQDNRFAEFRWPPDPDCPVWKYRFLGNCSHDLNSEEEKSETARKYLDQVRKSWGYDVDCRPPNWMGSLLYPIDLQSELGKWVRIEMEEAKECVIERINAEAKNIGKTFKLVSLDKAVTAAASCIC